MPVRAALQCTFVLLLLWSPAAHAAVPASERAALLAIHASTGGSAWWSQDGWAGAAGTECEWRGVTCSDDGSTVRALDLSYNNLIGTLPSEIENLRNLEELLLTGNELRGSIPAGIGSLSKLEVLALDENRFEGSLPASIGSLGSLRVLNARRNALTGVIPEGIGNLTSLEELVLSDNQLSGTIPSRIGDLVNLVGLNLANNSLSGQIPPQIANLAALDSLDLSSNQLSGSLPVGLANLTAIRHILLYGNSIGGPIPPGIGNLTMLITLGLESNELTGPIPASIGNLTALELLDLSGNLLDGTIPPSLQNLTALAFMNLGDNRLTGGIPPGLSRLTSLTDLHLWGNQLSGPIPAALGELTNLERLFLGINQLNGPIPRQLGALTKLRVLHFGGNQLEGSIPFELGNLTALEELNLAENRLSGPLPPSLGSLRELAWLDLRLNRLSGPIPDSFAGLTKIQDFYICCNELSGAIPSWIGDYTQLEAILLDHNRFRGPIPDSLWSIEGLFYLALQSNRLTGTISPQIGNLTNLGFLEIGDNDFEGSIPSSIANLENLIWLGLDNLGLEGTLDERIGNLRKLEVMNVQGNRIDGTIPPEIGELTELRYLSLDGNRLTGTIPPAIGNLNRLLELNLSRNALRGSVPLSLTALRDLSDVSGANLEYNALRVTDPAVRAFFEQKHVGGDAERTQTLTPANLRLTGITDRSAVLEWDPIAFVEEPGGYAVVATRPGSTTVLARATTRSKEITSVTIRGLEPQSAYAFRVAAATHPHGFQRNFVMSDPSAPVTGTTGPRVVAPPEVELTTPPSGLIQVDGVAQNEDSFVLTNFGDEPTTITLEQEGEFFAMTPLTFTLEGGASQTVDLQSVAQPAGGYWGVVFPTGAGTPENFYVPVTMLSVARPEGSVIGEAVTTRVEVTGLPGTDSLAIARFRNRGTATLFGVLVSDVPWLIPSNDRIQIFPGDTMSVNFLIRRSLRPRNGDAGSLVGHLELIYVAGNPGKSLAKPDPHGGTNVSRTVVQVVDVAQPGVSTGPIPPLGIGEVAFFVPGLASLATSGGSLVSDLGIANPAGSASIEDLKLYFNSPSSTTSSIASMSQLAVTQAVTLANPIRNVYSSTAGLGTIQIRTAGWQNLVLHAELLDIRDGVGIFAADLPAFRSDRSAGSGEAIYLAGIPTGTEREVTLFLQETSGAATSATIEFLDAAGARLGEARSETIEGFGMLELPDVGPASTATVVIRPSGDGRLAAYGRIFDQAGGDVWSVVDWSWFYRYPRTSAVRVPIVATTGAVVPGGPRRRTVRRGGTGGNSIESMAVGPLRTELVIFNPLDETAFGEILVQQAGGSSRTMPLELAPFETRRIADLVAATGAAGGPAYAVVTPQRGEMVVTARMASTEGEGTSVPAIAAPSGLREGQSQVFSGIEDSTEATIARATPGTFRSTLGLVESGGSSVKVRATLLLPSGRTLTASVFRDITLPANGMVTLEGIGKSILGSMRELGHPDLHDLQLRLEVVEGAGAVTPFVILTDNGTEDSILRLE